MADKPPPDDRTAEITQRLLSLEARLSASLQLIRALPAGLSNQSFLIQVNDRRAVLRLAASAPHLWGGNPDNELCVMQRAAEAGIAPAILYADAKASVLITAYLEPAAADPRVMIEPVADLLKSLHGLAPVAVELIPSGVSENYWRRLVASTPAVSALARLRPAMQAIMLAAETTYPRSALCHNDLVPDNLLTTQAGLMLIDWEYAAMNDPFLDLAALAYNFAFDRRQTAQLLHAYLGRVEAAERRHFQYAQAIYLYQDILWYLMREAEGQALLEPGALLHKIELLERWMAPLLDPQQRVDGI